MVCPTGRVSQGYSPMGGHKGGSPMGGPLGVVPQGGSKAVVPKWWSKIAGPLVFPPRAVPQGGAAGF